MTGSSPKYEIESRQGFLLTSSFLVKCLAYVCYKSETGYRIDMKLRSLTQLNERTNKIFSKFRYYIIAETLTSIYYSLFQLNILYSSTIWCYTSQKNVTRIFILQKRCMRLITFSEFQEYSRKKKKHENCKTSLSLIF